jgi:hypothetical protein
MSKVATLGFFLGTALAFAGCSESKGGNAPTSGSGGTVSICDLPAECQQISQACMPKDKGTGPVHDCHMTGMVKGVKADCQKDLQPCLKTCGEAPALGTGDGAVEDLFAGCRG